MNNEKFKYEQEYKDYIKTYKDKYYYPVLPKRIKTECEERGLGVYRKSSKAIILASIGRNGDVSPFLPKYTFHLDDNGEVEDINISYHICGRATSASVWVNKDILKLLLDFIDLINKQAPKIMEKKVSKKKKVSKNG